MIVDTEQPDENEQHEPGFPCPVCDVITIRQPWPSLIALGFKHHEFRSGNCHHRGAVVIHASQKWYAPALRDIVRMHMRIFTKNPDEAVRALFPFSLPVAEAVVTDCKRWTEKSYALTLDQVRIITKPKPALEGMLSVPWHTRDTDRTKELASALARARVLEGVEKNAVYQEFQLLALSMKSNGWMRGAGLGDFQLTAPSK
jgi:hypothetical protein